KLKENIGASTIIEYITEGLPKEKLAEVLGKDIAKIKDENVVNAGGGNSLFIMDNEDDAKEFITRTTRTVLEYFPGVEFFMAYESFDYNNDSIIDAIDKIYKKLNDKKSARASVFRKKSYGIEQNCVTTGLPAYKRYDGSFLSKESCIKRDWSDEKKIEEFFEKKNWKRYKEKKYDENTISKVINKFENEGYRFTKEIEDLITEKDENSYVAIISLDGNKMGEKIEHMRNEARKREDKNNMAESNKNYIENLYKFSNNIKKYYEKAFIDMLSVISSNYDKKQNIEEKLKLKEKNKGQDKKLMPVRPIILAGDDVCFICNAKIALECVNLFIKSLNQQDNNIEGKQLNACAGICMLKSSYPFDKGYEIAENLCKNGKAKIVDSNDASLVDFHICQGEISTSLNEIRSRAHINKDVELNIKPFYINITEAIEDEKKSGKYERIITKRDTFNTYENFKNEFKRVEEKTKDCKGKIRKLRDVFPQGIEKTRLFMNKNMITEDFSKGFGLPADAIKYGFYQIDGKNTCLYFDIIELQDMFINLDY
ncbi:Cas10/Cmr2 second palm domain-containing protein, partial [Intestinibacter bartlettii]